MAKHGKEKHEVKASGIVDRDHIIGYVENFLSSLKQGRVVVNCGEEHMTLYLPERVELEIEAEQEDGKHELSLELSWRDHMHAREIKDLRISSQELHSGEGNGHSESAGQERRESWQI
jgi:amphi-Trp domain-containing protein